MDLVTQLRRDEGVRYDLYKDQRGINTFGTGFTFPIDDAENDFILAHRIDKISQQLVVFAWFTALDEVRAGAVKNIAYNVGVAGLLHFAHMISALARQDWITTARECLDSEAAKENPERYERLASQFESGEWV